jgi:drug/metabolite transporter (DMT)-like permease
MTPGLWGAGCAICWGTADFVARFSGRAIGHHSSLLGMLGIGAALLTLWMLLERPQFAWSIDAATLVLLSGSCLMAGTLWLYLGVARGPISIVEPIVCSYPLVTVALTMLDGHSPGPCQAAFMAVTIVGVLVVARSTDSHVAGGHDALLLRGTIAASLASAAAFGLGVYFAQRALPEIGELPTLWSTRLVSLAALIVLMAALRQRPRLPSSWWPALGSQGVLDTGGYALLLQAGYGAGSGVAAVTASSYGVISTLLAWLILKERIGWGQWGGIGLAFGGVAGLSAL